MHTADWIHRIFFCKYLLDMKLAVSICMNNFMILALQVATILHGG